MDIGIFLFNKINADYLILSGGKTNSDIPYSEAEVMYSYLDSKLNKSKIIIEDKSLDTIGNAFFTRLIFENIRSINKGYIVSSCYHQRRAEYIFRVCFGTKYWLDFNYCDNFPILYDNEKQKYRWAKKLFFNIEPGNVNQIKDRLQKNHYLYKNLVL